jgi:hypothetical protein
MYLYCHIPLHKYELNKIKTYKHLVNPIHTKINISIFGPFTVKIERLSFMTFPKYTQGPFWAIKINMKKKKKIKGGPKIKYTRVAKWNSAAVRVRKIRWSEWG